MKIPKIIHYCWFGKRKQSKTILTCIDSWSKILPDFEIKRWDESNVTLDCNFAKDAYKNKKWAFVSDYVRFSVLSQYGGVYLDTDMLLLKPIDIFLEFEVFIGFENEQNIGCGIIGSVPKQPLINSCLQLYNELEFNIHFLPTVSRIVSDLLIPQLSKKNAPNNLKNKILILPPSVFYPFPLSMVDIDSYKNFIKEDSIAVHLWERSWHNEFNHILNKKWNAAYQIVIENIKSSNLSFSYITKLLYYLSGAMHLRYFTRNKIDFLIKLVLKNHFILQVVLERDILSVKQKKRILATESNLPLGSKKLIDRNGLKFHVDLGEHIGWGIYTGKFESSIKLLISKLNKEDTVIDIGANIGYYTINLTSFTKGKTYAFEPFSHNYYYLKKNYSENSSLNIEVYSIAIGEKTKTIRLYNKNEQNKGMVRVHPKKGQKSPMISLDSFFAKNRIHRLNFIKIDIEGSELSALKGAKKTITKFKPKLWIELNDNMLKKNNSSAIEILQFLEGIQYNIQKVPEFCELSSKNYLENCFFDIYCTPKYE